MMMMLMPMMMMLGDGRRGNDMHCEGPGAPGSDFGKTDMMMLMLMMMMLGDGRGGNDMHCEGPGAPGAPGDPAVVAAMAIAGARGALARLEVARSVTAMVTLFLKKCYNLKQI